MAGDGAELRILSAVKERESAAAAIVEKAQLEGERIEKDARERAEKDLKKAVEDAHAHAALYLEKARLDAHGEAEKIRAEGAMQADSVSKTAGRRLPKAVEFIVDDFLGGSG